MSNTTAPSIETTSVESITSLLLPIAEHALLLPSVSVAEMAGYRSPVPANNSPSWLLGFYSWRNQQVPLISYEALAGGSPVAACPTSRIAVLNNTGISDQLPFIAILTQGIPRLAHVAPDSIAEVEDAEAIDCTRMVVKLDGELALLPDVSAIEEAFLTWQSAQS